MNHQRRNLVLLLPIRKRLKPKRRRLRKKCLIKPLLTVLQPKHLQKKFALLKRQLPIRERRKKSLPIRLQKIKPLRRKQQQKRLLQRSLLPRKPLKKRLRRRNLRRRKQQKKRLLRRSLLPRKLRKKRPRRKRQPQKKLLRRKLLRRRLLPKKLLPKKPPQKKPPQKRLRHQRLPPCLHRQPEDLRRWGRSKVFCPKNLQRKQIRLPLRPQLQLQHLHPYQLRQQVLPSLLP
jgi:hypothetical protein